MLPSINVGNYYSISQILFHACDWDNANQIAFTLDFPQISITKEGKEDNSFSFLGTATVTAAEIQICSIKSEILLATAVMVKLTLWIYTDSSTNYKINLPSGGLQFFPSYQITLYCGLRTWILKVSLEPGSPDLPWF